MRQKMEATNRTMRACIVKEASDIGPGMRRLVVVGNALEPLFADPGIKEPGAWLKLFPPGVPGRAYTIRSVDVPARTITLDFVIHGEQPGTVSTWARNAQPGDELEVAGPRSGGFVLRPSTKWIWIGADASALPAAINIVESLPQSLSTRAVFTVINDIEPHPLADHVSADIRWLDASQAPTLIGAEDACLDRSAGQVWLAGEASWIKAWKSYWISTVGLEPRQVVAKGYWKAGELDYRD